ncbi:MAG: hypothetical protein ABI780_01830 [Ardenticatenales bacterium]
MANLMEGMRDELRRVRGIEEQYKSLRGQPGINVEFALAMMADAIRAAEDAQATGDIVAMIQCYQALKGFEA